MPDLPTALAPLKEADVRNVVVFMADAVRWDALPDTVADLGVSVRTVSASLKTHTSLPSMVSGYHPLRHGCLSWRDRLPRVPNLLELDAAGYECAYYQPGPEDVVEDGTFEVLRRDGRQSLSECLFADRFSYFERHDGAHAPFEGLRPWEGGWAAFVDEYAGDTSHLRTDYYRAADSSGADFRERLDLLDAEGLGNETLVVYCADHGELLGERGLVGHSTPLRPESVYVPTTFVHPSLDASVTAAGIARHVDLFPTLLDALGEDVPDAVDGASLLDSQPQTGYAISTGNWYRSDAVHHVTHSASLWDGDGGIVRNRSHIGRRVLGALKMVASGSWKATHLRRMPTQIPGALAHYLQRTRTYGAPGFDVGFTVDEIERIERREPVSDADQQELDETTRQRLRDLGYLGE